MPDSPEDIDVADTAAVETAEAAPATEAPPENFSSLGDALKEQVPGIENLLHTQTTDPKGNRIAGTEPTKRDETGKFLPKTAPLAQAEAEVKPAEEKKPEVTETDAAKTRDADLDAETDKQMSRNTRKRFDTVKAVAKVARDERDARAAEAAEAIKERDQLREQLKTQVVPKEVQEEVETLRSRVRELDISKDPALEAKYDAKIKTNSASAIELLKEQGLFMKVPEKDKPAVEMSPAEQKALTAEIEKGGIGIRGMAKYIRALEQGNEYEAAERLRALAQHNDRLAAEKTEEIGKWAKDYEGLKATRSQAEQAQRKGYEEAVQTHGKKTLEADLMELQKQLPFLNRPAEIVASDSADVKASKGKAIAEYDAAIATLTAGAKAYNTDGLPPEKAAEVTGRMTAAAIQSLILKQAVIPRLLKEAATMSARIKELEAGEAARRKAGTINRAHSAALEAPNNGKRAPSSDLSIEDALKQVMSENGVAVS